MRGRRGRPPRLGDTAEQDTAERRAGGAAGGDSQAGSARRGRPEPRGRAARDRRHKCYRDTGRRQTPPSLLVKDQPPSDWARHLASPQPAARARPGTASAVHGDRSFPGIRRGPRGGSSVQPSLRPLAPASQQSCARSRTNCTLTPSEAGGHRKGPAIRVPPLERPTCWGALSSAAPERAVQAGMGVRRGGTRPDPLGRRAVRWSPLLIKWQWSPLSPTRPPTSGALHMERARV